MRAWLGVLVIASACSTDPSVIDVYVPPGTTTVDVLLTNLCIGDQGLNCAPGIAWDDPRLPIQPPAEVFSSIGDGSRVIFPVPSSGPLRLRLQQSNMYKGVGRVVLVGNDASDMPVAMARIQDPPFTDDEIWKIQLEPITEVNDRIGDGPNMMEPEKTREHVWRSPAGDETCAVYQTWNDDFLKWDRETYGPAHDLDCDGIASDTDCNPQWYEYGKLATANVAPSCSIDTGPLVPDACTVGTQMPLCADDGTSTVKCVQQPELRCMPDLMCVECPVFASGCGDAAVVTQLERDVSRLPYIKCDIAYSTDPNTMGQPCTSQGNDSAMFDLGSLGCSNLAIYQRDWPPTAMPFGQSFTIAGTASFNQQVSNCAMSLTFTQGPAPVATPHQQFVLGIHVSSAELEIPLVMTFLAGCSNDTKCSPRNIQNDDKIWTCLPP